MTDRTSCPGCGAPIAGWRCEYCGREHPYRCAGDGLTNVAPSLWGGSIVQASQSTIDALRNWQAKMAYEMCGVREVWRP